MKKFLGILRCLINFKYNLSTHSFHFASHLLEETLYQFFSATLNSFRAILHDPDDTGSGMIY